MTMYSDNFPMVVNGDHVIGMMSSAQAKASGWNDLSTLDSWYHEDPINKHLGMVELFANFSEEPIPVGRNFFDSRAIIEVNGLGGSGYFTYDLAVTTTDEVVVAEDSSDIDCPGIDDSLFPLHLSHKFTNGDVLTYDFMYGEQVMVSEDKPVEDMGTYYTHWVRYVSHGEGSYFPADKLRPGIEYFKLGHSLGEYSTQFSEVQSAHSTASLKCQFTLHNHRGVEYYETAYAGSKSIGPDTAVSSKNFIDKFIELQDRLGTDTMGNKMEHVIIAQKKAGSRTLSSAGAAIGDIWEYLILKELMKLESFQLLFQRGGTIHDQKGTKRVNEGIYHQIRRGVIIKYSRPGGFTKNHLKRISQHIFQGTQISTEDRRFKMKVGKKLYDNIQELYKEEFRTQLANLGFLAGAASLVSKPLVTGSFDSLTVQKMSVGAIQLLGVGWAEVEHDPSMDYRPYADRRSSGFFGEGGYSAEAYSGVIWDLADPKYSNARSSSKMPDNVKLVKGGNARSNIFYVKPEGISAYQWGTENGRYSNRKSGSTASANRHMGHGYWAWSSSAGWVKDITRYLTVELEGVHNS